MSTGVWVLRDVLFLCNKTTLLSGSGKEEEEKENK